MDVEDVEPESREDSGSDEQDEEEKSMTSMDGKEAVLKDRVGIEGGEGRARGADEAEDVGEWWFRGGIEYCLAREPDTERGVITLEDEEARGGGGGGATEDWYAGGGASSKLCS